MSEIPRLIQDLTTGNLKAVYGLPAYQQPCKHIPVTKAAIATLPEFISSENVHDIVTSFRIFAAKYPNTENCGYYENTFWLEKDGHTYYRTTTGKLITAVTYHAAI